MGTAETALETQESLRIREYADSMSTADHLRVLFERAQSMKGGGDWKVFNSLTAVVNNLGSLVTAAELDYTQAIDLVEARNKLKEVDTLGDSDAQTTPADPTMHGILVGIHRFLEGAIESRVEAKQ